MKKVMKYIAVLLASVALAGCSEDGLETNNGSAPIVLNRFYPTTGGAGTEVVLTGENFSERTEDISVRVGNHDLKVIGSDMNNIVVMIPRSMGSGRFEVSIAGRAPVHTLQRFSYVFSGAVTTLAGGGEAGDMNGIGTAAQFHFDDADNGGWRKGSIGVDPDGNVFVIDIVNDNLKKITPEGEVTTLVARCTNGDDNRAYAMDVDDEGNIWFVTMSGWAIYKVTPDGASNYVGQSPCQPWYMDVDSRNDRIFFVHQADGSSSPLFEYTISTQESRQIATETCYSAVAVAPDGSALYASNTTSHCLDRFPRTGDGWGPAERFAGSGVRGFADGTFATAQFSMPRGLAFSPSGDLFVAGNGEWGGVANADQAVRRLNMADGEVLTVAGSGTAGYVDAFGTAAAFSGVMDLTIDRDGVIYLFDKKNNAVRKIVYE